MSIFGDRLPTRNVWARTGPNCAWHLCTAHPMLCAPTQYEAPAHAAHLRTALVAALHQSWTPWPEIEGTPPPGDKVCAWCARNAPEDA